MKLRFLIPRYFVALVVTLSACGIYTSLIAPRIEGSPDIGRQPAAIPAPIRPAEDIKQSLAGLFPEEGWEWDPCTILESRQARILFQDHTILDDGSVELKPLSLVLTPTSRPGQETSAPPIVLRAPEGARLKFENGLSAGGDLGQLEHGQLMGEVQIFRPASDPSKDDALALVTHNVQISPERIYTLYDCDFRFGQSQGRGRHLTVDLLGPGSQTEPGSVFSGVQRIEMARLYELVLRRQPGETIEAPRENDLLGDTQQSLMITSNGPMLFDFNAGTASFEDQVRVQSLEDQGDRLDCDRLTIVLESPEEPADGSRRSTTPRYDVQRLVAEGSPAVLTSQTQQAQAIAQRIDYDLVAKQVTLLSNDVVKLTRHGQQIQAREIRYAFNEDRRLGTATMLGPGWVRQPAEDGQGEFQCHWQNTLTLQDDNGKKVISLDRARVQMNDTTLLANQLHLWLWEIPETGPDGKQRWRFQPAKMFANGQVMIEAERLKGDCSEAAAFWPAPQVGAAVSAPRNRVETRRIAVPQEQTQTHRNLAWQSTQTRNATTLQRQVQETPVRHAGHVQPAATPSFTRFVGHQVQLQMRGGANPGAIDEITVDGDVVIQQQQPLSSGSSETTLEIRGQKLRVKARNENQYRLFVTGDSQQPAIVSAREIVLQGPAIHLDQPANRLWIEGPGRMRIDNSQQGSPPSNTSPNQQRGRAGDNSGLLPAGTTHVNWLGGMVFDGQKIYFETAVQSRSRQSNERELSTTALSTSSAALSIVLNRRIDFSDVEEGQADQLKADRLVMVGWMEAGDVAFPKTFAPATTRTVSISSAKYDASGQLAGTQEIAAPRATFDVRSGLASCRGPGFVMARQPAGSADNPSTTPAMLASTGQRNGNIDFVKVEFEDRFDGQLEQRELHFTGNVRAFYTDISQWDAVPDERSIQQTGSRGVILDCEDLVLVQWTPQQAEPTVELIATGNARVKGHQFDGSAERISYIQSSGRVTIEAPTRANAELWFRQPGQNNRAHLVAKTITYDLETGAYEVQEYKQMDYSQEGRIRDR